MKLARIVDPKFQAALRKLNQEQLPLKVAFKLKGISKRVEEELQKYNDLRVEALNKFGQKDSDGNLVLSENQVVQFSDEAAQGFVKEMNELLNLEVALDTISINDLSDNIKMTVEELVYLEDLLV
jgi:hypothetical protein